MAGIIGLAGQPRSGKSYSSIELFVLPSLKQGRRILTNLPIKMEAVKKDFPGAQIEFIDDLLTYPWDKVGDGVLLILDEVWRLWPQGMNAKALPMSQLSLLKEHGHRSDAGGRSMDIVLITQDMADLCATVRNLVESTIICVKHLDLCSENAFIRYKCRKAASLTKDNVPPRNQLISSENGKYNASVYQYYKTHMNSADGVIPNESRIVKTSIFNSFRFKFGVGALVFCIIAMIWGVGATKEKMAKVGVIQKPASTGTVPVPVSIAPVAVAIKPPAQQARPENTQMPLYSGKWRIAGYLHNLVKPNAKPVYILMTAKKTKRLVSAERCKKVDLEIYCDIDGEKVTFFSGQETQGYDVALK